MRPLWAFLLIASFAAPMTAGDEWKMTRIDSNATAGYRSVCADSKGRLFVGGRESLYVTEPGQPARIIYRFPRNSSINGLVIRGDDVFVLTATALYVIPDAARKRIDLQSRKLLWGAPGGVFRSLAWGPEGDLYIAFANAAAENRLAYWTFFSADKSKTPYRGQGGIVRCKPDGSDVRVIVRDLQRPGSLVFDPTWNLFTADGGALRHVAQFAAATVAERIRSPLACLDDALVNAGPENLARIKIKPHGASFRGQAVHLMPCKEAISLTVSGTQLFAVLASGEVVAMANTKPAPTFEATEATAATLWDALSDQSLDRRRTAHLEFLRRGGDLLKDANPRLLKTKVNDRAFPPLIWLAAKSGQGSLHLLGCLEHTDPIVRAQAVRALAEYPEQLREEPIFTRALTDSNPHVQLAAMSALFSPKVSWSRPTQLLIERGPARSDDPLLRETAARLLARHATHKQLEDLCASADEKRRLAGVLAIGFRLTEPANGMPLPAHLPLKSFGEESAYVLEYDDGKVDLREHGRLGSFTLAEHWKLDKHTEDVHLLLKRLQSITKDSDDTVRIQALAFVASLFPTPMAPK